MPCLHREWYDAFLKKMFIDTHSHLFLTEFDHDRDEAINRALRSGIHKIFLPNVDSHTIGPMLDLAGSYPGKLYPMMGLHPTSAKENYKEELKFVEEWFSKEKFYAVGETGIDLFWDKTHLKEQTDSFIQQIKIARNYNIPLVIHSRESFDEIFRILDQELTGSEKGIFHAFTGTYEEAMKVFEYGFFIGIGGIITFKNSGLGQVIEKTGADHIVLETDAPYLAPVPYRGKRNEPAYIVYTARKLADILGIKVQEIERITTENALNIFSLQNSEL
jgi:TatD DNase family protein